MSRGPRLAAHGAVSHRCRCAAIAGWQDRTLSGLGLSQERSLRIPAKTCPNTRQQKIASGHGRRAVTERVPIQDLARRDARTRRELPPGEIDRDRPLPDDEFAPEVDLLSGAGPHGSLDDLARGEEVLHHARGGVALADGGVVLHPHTAVGRSRAPRSLECFAQHDQVDRVSRRQVSITEHTGRLGPGRRRRGQPTTLKGTTMRFTSEQRLDDGTSASAFQKSPGWVSSAGDPARR